MRNFNTIEEAINDIRLGKMVVVVDDEDRENEGDLILAAEKVTPDAINFMVKHAGGLICMPIIQKRLDELNIEMMVHNNTDKKQTAFTVSIDYAGAATGISAYERAETIRRVVDSSSRPQDFNRPGHIFPLVAKEHGVLERSGHTEAAVDLCRLAGLYPAGVICEIMNDDGSMSRVPDLMDYVDRFDLKIITIADLISYRRANENIVSQEAIAEMPTTHGDFKVVGFVNKINGDHHIALVKGELNSDEPVLVRIHSECLTGDVFGSKRCDCGEQLHEAMDRIEATGRGVLLYLRQEGRGIGLINKLKAYELQEKGMDTVEANLALGFKPDLRDYGVAAEILAELGIKKIILMTNNPMKITGLAGYGLTVVDRQPIEMNCNEQNQFYMQTKFLKMGHLLHV
ncbi:MAG: bifunctional 3,4-dihydroxy-2-butanone-4-phosphate synthase/GTP cyclohydrolase II [Bacteroidetes bacterium]|nr:bifunctional 3,4-dihydroxy-2-butanone-4-phosphate synthase/GTP cyclohydrolase II [Bacteroidota bacterium]